MKINKFHWLVSVIIPNPSKRDGKVKIAFKNSITSFATQYYILFQIYPLLIDRAELSEEVVQQYKNDGAVLLKGVFNQEWVDLIAEGITR